MTANHSFPQLAFFVVVACNHSLTQLGLMVATCRTHVVVITHAAVVSAVYVMTPLIANSLMTPKNATRVYAGYSAVSR